MKTIHVKLPHKARELKQEKKYRNQVSVHPTNQHQLGQAPQKKPPHVIVLEMGPQNTPAKFADIRYDEGRPMLSPCDELCRFGIAYHPICRKERLAWETFSTRKGTKENRVEINKCGCFASPNPRREKKKSRQLFPPPDYHICKSHTKRPITHQKKGFSRTLRRNTQDI